MIAPENIEAARLMGAASPEPPFFAEDFTSLKWHSKDHLSGESATFDVCGLHAYVKDMDGDACD